MSSFTTQPWFEPIPNSRNQIVRRGFTYHIGSEYSNDKVVIPVGFITDFASVPFIFWWIFPPWGRYGKAAVLHDWLYQRRFENKVRCEICKKVFNGEDASEHRIETEHNSWELILGKTRKEADDIFLEAMGVLNVRWWRKYPMYLAVRWFGGLAWKDK